MRGRETLRADLPLGVVNRWVEEKISPTFNLWSDDAERLAADHGGMTMTEYLLKAAFVLLVLRQARERELDRRSVTAGLRPPRSEPHAVKSVSHVFDLPVLANLPAEGARIGWRETKPAAKRQQNHGHPGPTV